MTVKNCEKREQRELKRARENYEQIVTKERWNGEKYVATTTATDFVERYSTKVDTSKLH
jgi:hypothetical protein